MPAKKTRAKPSGSRSPKSASKPKSAAKAKPAARSAAKPAKAAKPAQAAAKPAKKRGAKAAAKKPSAMARIKSGVGSFFARITGREAKPKAKTPPVADPAAEVITTAEIIAVRNVGEPSGEMPAPPPPGKP